MLLETDHFVDKQANFIKIITNFFNGWYGNSFISKELALKEPLDDVMLHPGNCWDIQMALRTDHFVDRTFRGPKWSRTEQLVKGFEPLILKHFEKAG